MEPPSDLMSSAIAEIETTRRPNRFSWLPAAGAVAAVAVVLAVVAANWFGFNPTPIGTADDEPSSTPVASATPTGSPTPAPIVEPPPFESLPSGGELVERISVGDAGGPILYAHGSVWLGVAESDVISRLDPATGEIVATIPMNEEPGSPSDALAVADDEFVYATGYGEPIVKKIDPATNEVVERFDIGTVAYRMSMSGSLIWITDLDGGRLTRLDTDTGEVTSTPYPLRTGGILATDDTVWMVPYSDAQLMEIDPATLDTREEFGAWAYGMQIITDGADSLYISGNNGRPVERFSLAEGRVVARTPEMAMVALADGTLYGLHWERKLMVLDPETLEWSAGIDLGGTGGETYGIVAGDGHLWIGHGTDLLKVRPAE